MNKKTKIIPDKQFIPSTKFIALINNKKQRHVKKMSNGKLILYITELKFIKFKLKVLFD